MEFVSLLLSLCVVVICVSIHRWYCSRWRSTKIQKSSTLTATTSGESNKSLAPYPTQPIKGRDRYRVLMDIRKLDARNWLTLDTNYLDEHRIRSQLLEQNKHKVLQCLPESYEACQEVLDEVSKFLCQRYPEIFEVVQDKARGGVDGEHSIRNKLTSEIFAVGKTSHRADALEKAVRLTSEDLSVLMTNQDDEYYLAASATLFPVGWTVDERIGWSIAQLHGPVPLWQQQVGHSVSKFFSRLDPDHPMERSNYFVEVRRPGENLLETLYRPDTLCEQGLNPQPQDIVIRKERQTFRRLSRTGAIVFGVKTTLTTLDELPMLELQNLAREVKSWPDHVSEYKGRQVWGPRVLEFCELRTKMSDGLGNEAAQ